MTSQEKIQEHLDVIGRLIADTEYHFTNLQHLTQLKDDDQKVVNGFLVLRNYRSILWNLVVLDLNKLLSKSNNDKFSVRKLINIIIQERNKVFWMHQVDLVQLKSYKVTLTQFDDKIDKLTVIRDKHVAHFDNKKLHFTISVSELCDLIDFCKMVHNSISYWLSERKFHWYSAEFDMIDPIIYNLQKFSKIRNLFFEHHRANKSHIEMAELSKIIRPQAQGNIVQNQD